jgi:hypothetical protein
MGHFSVAVTHGKGKDSGWVIRVYLDIIKDAIKLVEIVSSANEPAEGNEEK